MIIGLCPQTVYAENETRQAEKSHCYVAWD